MVFNNRFFFCFFFFKIQSNDEWRPDEFQMAPRFRSWKGREYEGGTLKKWAHQSWATYAVRSYEKISPVVEVLKQV